MYVQDRLTKVKQIRILNPLYNRRRQPIFSFMIDQLHYNLIVVLLNDLFGIQTRGGISCCSLLAQDLLHIGPTQQKKIHDQIVTGHGNPPDYGWCRISFHYSMPFFIVDYLVDAISFIAQYGRYFRRLYKYYPTKNTWLYCPRGCPWADFDRLRLSLDDYMTPTEVVYLTPTILQRQMAFAKELLKRFLDKSI